MKENKSGITKSARVVGVGGELENRAPFIRLGDSHTPAPQKKQRSI